MANSKNKFGIPSKVSSKSQQDENSTVSAEIILDENYESWKETLFEIIEEGHLCHDPMRLFVTKTLSEVRKAASTPHNCNALQTQETHEQTKEDDRLKECREEFNKLASEYPENFDQCVLERIQNADSGFAELFLSAATVQIERLRKENLGRLWNVEFSTFDDRLGKPRLKWRFPPGTWNWVSKKDFQKLLVELKNKDWNLLIADDLSKSLLRQGIEAARLRLSGETVQNSIEKTLS